jgi:amino acid transporter
VDVISSVALTFFAYLGFAVISFTGGDLPDPARNLPRAMYLALGITTALYVLICRGRLRNAHRRGGARQR